jgi:hypothetical protein
VIREVLARVGASPVANGVVYGLTILLSLFIVYSYTYEPELISREPLETVYFLCTIVFLQAIMLIASEWQIYEAERRDDLGP